MSPRDRERLLALTTELLPEELAKVHPICEEFDRAEFGVCEFVAVAGARAARRLGIRCEILTGTVHDRHGRRLPPPWHAWLKLPGGYVLDSPQRGVITLATTAERGIEYRRFR